MEGSSDATHSGRVSELARIARPLGSARVRRELTPNVPWAKPYGVDLVSEHREGSDAEDHQDQSRGHLEAVFKLLACGDGRGRAEARILRRPGRGGRGRHRAAARRFRRPGQDDVTKITIYICNPHDVPKARGI